MTSLLTGALRGTAAGAAGTTALNLASTTDMAVRGRGASDAPAETASALAEQLGASIPGRRGERRNRRQALGSLSGTVTGLGVGAVAGALRAAGVRLPTAVGGPLLGAAAMLASDLPMARLGLTDPRRWSGTDWAADVAPHLAYGIATHATLVSTFRADDHDRLEHPAGVRARAPLGALVRATALGAASGCRSTVGITAMAIRARATDPGALRHLAGRGRRGLAGALALAEAGADKHPATPPRTAAPGLAPRVVLAATSAQALTRRDHHESGPAALLAAGAAVGTALAGPTLRSAAHARCGSDLPGALVEDGVALLLAWFGSGGRART